MKFSNQTSIGVGAAVLALIAMILVIRRRRGAARNTEISVSAMAKPPALAVRVAVMDGDDLLAEWKWPVVRAEAPLVEEAVETATTAQPLRFLVDSLMLIESYRFVCGTAQRQQGQPRATDGFVEVFHYATGMQLDERTFVINHLVPVEFAEQSAVGVRVADGSNVATLEWLDQIGLPLVAHFHSHPTAGPPHPSGTDDRFQERLERGGHVAVGAVFSRDGFLRFFGGKGTEFAVEVRGNHVRQIDEKLYQVLPGEARIPSAVRRRL